MGFSNILTEFDRADETRIDCGSFGIVLRPMNMANPEYRKAVLSVARGKKNSVAKKDGLLGGTLEEDIQIFCKTVVVGWDGVKDDDGKVVPFSVSACFEMLNSKAGRGLYLKLADAAAQDDTFKMEIEGN
jgi:hypothetical protein